MNIDTARSFTDSLSCNWQTWLVLRHFLPARLQRQLVHEIVSLASKGTVKFADLFEELVVDQPVWNEAWMIRPHTGLKDYAAALQHWARSIAWQNDEDTLLSPEDEKDSNLLSLVFLNLVTSLSRADFGWPDDAFTGYLDRYKAQIQPSLQTSLDAFKAARNSRDAQEPIAYWNEIVVMVASVEMPLQAIMLKHFADLCADSDAWKHAFEGYQRVASLLADCPIVPGFEDATKAWKTILLQSRACALRMLQAPTSEPTILETAIDATTLDADPVLAANAGLDMLAICNSMFDEREYKDPRISLQWSPLLHAAQDTQYALGNWMNARYDDASRRFWSVLRRQIALGAATEMRATKGWYARCMVEQIAAKMDEHDHESSFVMAMRLLLESENEKHVERIEWTPRLVDAVITKEEVIDKLLGHAHAHEGVKVARTMVLIELFRVWALKLTASRSALIEKIWKHLAHIARDFEAAFEHRADVGRPALKALQELGKKRPELIPAVGAEVAEAICKKLREEFVWGRSEAAEAALPYAETVDLDSLRNMTAGILEVLENEDPARECWPLTRPALRFLVEHHVRTRLKDEAELNRRALDQIFRHSEGEGNQAMMVFFHLADFDDKLLDEEATREKLAEPLANVRKRALKLTSSNVMDHIRALLVAPQVAGYEGIRDALDSLQKIIELAKSDERASLGFTSIDGSLMLLADQNWLKRIRDAIPQNQIWFDAKLVEIADRLAEMWEFAPSKPIIFAPFAIPPRTKPNPVVIHNIAFASIRFAQAIGRQERMRQALEKACVDDLLRSQIQIARATHLSGSNHAAEDPGEIGNEHRDTFYEALGRRLTQLQRMTPDAAKSFIKQLVDKCFQLGPHPGDAAVLIIAANLGMQEQVRAAGLRAYEMRARQNPETRMLVIPILDLFAITKTHDSAD